jgi:nitrogen fixation/metabolism regulation signal transduction histidine kinase
LATTDFVIDDDKTPVVKQDEKIKSLKNHRVKSRFQFGMVQKLFFFITVPMAIAAAIYIAHGILKLIESSK